MNAVSLEAEGLSLLPKCYADEIYQKHTHTHTNPTKNKLYTTVICEYNAKLNIDFPQKGPRAVLFSQLWKTVLGCMIRGLEFQSYWFK